MNQIVNVGEKLYSFSARVLPWYLKRFTLGKDSPLIATFQLTHRCNLRCKMCNLWRDPQGATLPLDNFKKIINDLGALGCFYTSLSGGEPLLIKGILTYISHAKSRIPYVNLVTNGLLLSRDMAKGLAETGLDTISISIDGLEKTHDDIRGKGSFAKTLGGINNIKSNAPNIKVIVNTVISPWNLEELLELVNIVGDLGVYHKFQPIYDHPLFQDQTSHSEPWKISDSQIERLKEVVECLKTKRNVANSKYYLSAIPNYFLGKNKGGLFGEKCKSVHYYCEIRENGELYPCLEGMQWKGGFKLKEDFKTTYYSADYKKTVRRLENCTRCQEILPICYMEPRIAFPLSSYVKYTLWPNLLYTFNGHSRAN